MIPLLIMCPAMGDRMPLWDKFLECMDQRAEVKGHESDMITEATQELALYGAHTNWTDDNDPVWFPDEDALTSFVLSYS